MPKRVSEIGHIHNKTNADYWPLILNDAQKLNAGVEANRYKPVTLSEMIENNRRFKACAPAQNITFDGEDV